MTAPWWDDWWSWFEQAQRGLFDPPIKLDFEKDPNNALCAMEQWWAVKVGLTDK